MLLAEANQWPPDVLPYFGDGSNECHMAFHFPLMPRIWIALRREDRFPIVEIMEQTPEIPESSQWALFLRNHDELTLEMVTDEERDYMYNEYARDARMRINVGIRRRLAPLVDNSRRRLELLNSLLFSMRGTPVIYYGDEIGMGDNVYLGDRNGVRTPMQWTGDRNAGFSKADVQALYAPVVADPVYGYQAVNVEAQQRIPGSLLNWMKRLIRIRRAHPVFGRGTLEFLNPDNRRVVAYLREHEGVSVLCVANLSRFAQYVELDLRALRRTRAGRAGRARPLPADRRAAVPADPRAARLLLVRAHPTRWLRPRASRPSGSPRSAGSARRGVRSRPSPRSTARYSAPARQLTVLELTYADGGEPHRYLAPTVEGREPRDGEGAWASIVIAIAAGPCSRGPAAASAPPAPTRPGRPARRRPARTPPRASSSPTPRSGSGTGSSSRCTGCWRTGENPEVEVSAFLTDAGFADTPALAGAMTYEADGAASAAAMLQAFEPSTGDAWATMLRALAQDADGALAMVERIGDLTARMHAALASRPDDPAFPARAATPAETAAWRASAERQLAQAVTAVSGPPHDRLVALAPRITARFADTFGSATGEARVSRIHGDYHLAQLLTRADGSFSVIDFEGEPARPLAERRAAASPLRDVAGMLRSLDYAARSAEAGSPAPGFAAEAWLARARAALLDGYGGIAADERPLLAAFELEKACYEVRYEAGNRPDWLWLPLAAVERLAGG